MTKWMRRSRGYGWCCFAGGKGNCRQRQQSGAQSFETGGLLRVETRGIHDQ